MQKTGRHVAVHPSHGGKSPRKVILGCFDGTIGRSACLFVCFLLRAAVLCHHGGDLGEAAGAGVAVGAALIYPAAGVLVAAISLILFGLALERD